MTTFNDVLAARSVEIPAGLEAQAEVPVLTGPQRQGDVGIFVRKPLSATQLDRMPVVPAAGLAVVRGESGGNAHWLLPEGLVRWQEAAPNGDPAAVLLGTLVVDEGAVAFLVHDDEHGANGIGPGTYTLHGKRELAETLRRVAD